MRVLFLYPKFPPSFWSFDRTIEMLGKKAMLPPLGLVTVAALLPQEWEFKLVDRNVRDVSEAEWEWADLVMLGAMIVQKPDLHAQIRAAKRRGKTVVVGGPYATALPHEVERSGADFLVLDEGEVTIPMFLAALERGETHGVFRSPNGEKPDVTHTPVPRFDLLQLNAYSEMSVQFSRGCPFLCEFCDIIVLYGRKPRTKTPQQLLNELQCLYDLGWRRSVFVVDDNFIGNKKNVKAFLQELEPWMVEHGYPFSFATEASVDLAQDQELMDRMRACNFGAVFLGIETPDAESLTLTKKTQNNRDPLEDSVRRIARSGIRVMAGFIIGFDNEKPGAGQRIVEFCERTSIPTVAFSMLHALPDTGLTKRLTAAGRMIQEREGNLNQTTLMNFVPTRPVEQIAREYVEGFWTLYDASVFLDRVYRHFQDLKQADYPRKPKRSGKKMDHGRVRAMLTLFFRQGLLRKTRFNFWKQLIQMYRENPGGIGSYLSTCAQAEHFLSYRKLVRQEIERQIEQHLANQREASASPLPVPAAEVETPSSPSRVSVSLHVLTGGLRPAGMGEGK